jgi:deoxyribodipyrimidine photo-lyase
MNNEKTNQISGIFWFRRDLRLDDNKGLFFALKENPDVLPIFIFDTDILNGLPENDARVEYIHLSLGEIQKKLQRSGKSLLIRKGKPIDVIKELVVNFQVGSIYVNADHEPYGIKRDHEIAVFLEQKGIPFNSFSDHLLFGKDEILKAYHSPYNVFTPYSKKCYEVLNNNHFQEMPSENLLKNLADLRGNKFPSLEELGFKPSGIEFPSRSIDQSIISSYHQTRDYPSRNGTSRLGIHLRFGTISIRKLASIAFDQNSTFFNELLWREFYAMILWHYPHVTTRAFKPQYDKIPWRNNEKEFECWKNGKTGYPMVDAGMRELAKTGYMHNRVRMITASFLTKHLLIDWRWGEDWFAKTLLDFELSSNNGGWQWSAGSGCDAAPYFRIFNPIEQHKKFDPRGIYILKWIPEYNTSEYPQPIVEHKLARERCLKTYKSALNGALGF